MATSHTLSLLVEQVISPDEANGIVESMLALPDTFEPSLVNPTSVGGVGAMALHHPAIIRAAARRGTVFYIGADKQAHRLTLSREERRDFKTIDPAAPLAAVDPAFYWTPPWLSDLRAFVEHGESVLLIGSAGAGKTEGVEQVFRCRNQPLHVVNCTPSMTSDDMEGRTDLVAGETKFTFASPAIAVERGQGLLLDEADACPAETLYSLYRILTRKDMHILRLGETGVIKRHAEFRVVGTQNTQGRGDDRGLHHGRAYQDEAFLDRWDQSIRVGYPEKENEVLILRKRTGISPTSAEKIVTVAAAMRQAQDDLMFVCSIRRTISVANNIAAGMTPERAWQFAVLNRVTDEDQMKLREALQRIYGDRLKKSISA